MNTPKIELVGNSIEILLVNQRKGKMLTELSEQMQAVALAAREHNEPATLILTLKVSPASGDGSAMSVSDEIKVKLPQPKKPRSLFFITENGVLVRKDPNQSEMTLETVPKTEPSTPASAEEAYAG